MQEPAPRSRADLTQQIIREAEADENFRRELMSDPRSALVTRFDIPVPQGIDIEVVEESLAKVYIVLPPPTGGSHELSDEELAFVAGGNSPWDPR